MTRIGNLLLIVLLTVTIGACVQTRPLMSHSHIGHALTTWHDTPGKRGLYVVAAKELDVAIAAADQAIASGADPRRSSKHLDNVLHALNPDLQRFGAGLDYGAIRALQGAIEHLEYAAGSEDASDNFVSSVVTLADQGDLVLARLVRAQQAIAEIDRNDPAADPGLRVVRELLMAAKFGDPNAAPVGDTMADADRGLVHITADLEAMLKRETDPAYEPVPRRYVLGLVRLPSGRWGYRLAAPAKSSGGYSY